MAVGPKGNIREHTVVGQGRVKYLRSRFEAGHCFLW